MAMTVYVVYLWEEGRIKLVMYGRPGLPSCCYQAGEKVKINVATYGIPPLDDF